MKKTTHLTLKERAAQLSAPQPGKAVTIPLELAPYWLELHNREIISFDERRFLYKGQRRASCIRNDEKKDNNPHK